VHVCVRWGRGKGGKDEKRGREKRDGSESKKGEKEKGKKERERVVISIEQVGKQTKM
jgi:hypothetical protein